MTKIKEIQLTLRIHENDLKRKISHIEEFLTKGNLVRIKLKFRYRELRRESEALDLMNDISSNLKLVSKVLNKPTMKPGAVGQNMIMMLTPK